jgi:hypothetical protein
MIISNVELVGKANPDVNTQYRVNYKLQDVDDDEYTLT